MSWPEDWGCCVCETRVGGVGQGVSHHQCDLVFCDSCYASIGGSAQVIRLAQLIEPEVHEFRARRMQEAVRALAEPS